MLNSDFVSVVTKVFVYQTKSPDTVLPTFLINLVRLKCVCVLLHCGTMLV